MDVYDGTFLLRFSTLPGAQNQQVSLSMPPNIGSRKLRCLEIREAGGKRMTAGVWTGLIYKTDSLATQETWDAEVIEGMARKRKGQRA